MKKNGVISIEVFEVMQMVAEKHGIKQTEWAKAAFGRSDYQSRISELITKAENKETATGRAFSVDKCMKLLNGLEKILGGDIVSKELKEMLKKAKTDRERLIILALAAKDDDVSILRKQVEAVVLKD